jgi:type I restriction enzyme R subunit
VKFYLELRKDIGQASGDFLDLKPYEPDMRYLIDTYISADDSERLAVLDDFTLMDFIDEKTVSDTDKPATDKEKDAVTETIENNITKELVQKRLVNPAFFERMSQVLRKLIEDRKAGVLEYKKLLEAYRKLAENVEHPETTGDYPASISDNPVKQALYDNFGKDEKLTLALHRAFLGSRLNGFRYNTARKNQIKQALYEVLNDEARVEEVYAILEAQEG